MRTLNILPIASQLHTVRDGSLEVRILINFNHAAGENTMTFWHTRDSECPDISGALVREGAFFTFGKPQIFVYVLNTKRLMVGYISDLRLSAQGGEQCL